MPPEENSEHKVTPLSQGLRNRQFSSLGEKPEEKFVTEERLKELLFEQVSKPIVAKLTRLENSINSMAKQFEAIRNGEAKDAALRVTTDQDATDLALVEVNVPKEEYYPYTCALLADKLEVRIYDVTEMIKKLGIRNNIKYHNTISIGRKSKVQKWSELTLQRLKETLATGEYTTSV